MTTEIGTADWDVIIWMYGAPLRVSSHRTWDAAQREAARWTRDGINAVTRFASQSRPYWWDLASAVVSQYPGASSRYEQARQQNPTMPPLDVATSSVRSAA